ncbi:hypothetical protein EUGRSUZ_L00506 [Eucalyptus grandis]|uniref:Uncharacterized protein n=2 Tax=Eucalyptus grandis TaxID=71139 RepID=A0ACC3JMC6_EUCGR|nr:hypothetical protein EUGRSUZ_L00506 [Eucalyptus grandis]
MEPQRLRPAAAGSLRCIGRCAAEPLVREHSATTAVPRPACSPRVRDPLLQLRRPDARATSTRRPTPSPPERRPSTSRHLRPVLAAPLPAAAAPLSDSCSSSPPAAPRR